ncbi:MAG: ankyrin repeat domain-containing protein, partial [Candidatus Symbiodolus clandestinus]
TLGLSGYWLVPRNSSALKQLHILGQLDQKNAILILTETQYTLIRFTATLQPEFVLVEHDTAQAHLNTSLRLQRAEKDTQFAQWFPTPEEGMRVIQGLTVLATLPSEGRGAVLILQSPLGYPEIHRFPNSSQCITLNDLHYQVGPGGKLYVVGTIDGRITADRLLRYNDTEHRPVGLSFPTALNASQLALDNGTLSVNQIQLIQLPEQTPLYFGPLDQQQEIISLLALQDTVLPPSTKPPEAILPESSAHPHRHHHQRRHRRQIPDMPSSASRPTPWITTLWKGLLERLPFYSTPLLGLGIREKPTDPPVTKEIFSEPSEPLDLDKLNSLMMMLSFFLALRRIRKQQKPTAKSLPSEQAITEEQRIEWRKQLDKLEKNVEDLFKRVARDGKIVNKRHEWPQWWLEDLQEQYGQLTQLDQASQEEITVFEEKLQATLNELDEILRPSAVPPGWKRHAGQSFHKTDTTEPEPKPKPAEDLDDIIQDINILFSENSDIISAINKNDLTRVRSYIEENKNVNARSKGGRPLLMVAVESSCSDELIELLIDNGADINAEDRDGESAINLAVYNGSFRLIKLLINKGVKIKDKTEKNSPFSSVAESGLPQRTQDQVIKLLTECKYIDKTSNTTNLTRILVQQVPAMHSSLVDNAFTSLSISNPDPVYSNRVSGLLPMSSQ